MSQHLPNPDIVISEIKKEIETIEHGLTDNALSNLFCETKKSTLLYLAERYEGLFELGASDISTKQIANHFLTKFKKINVNLSKS